jgi:ABC-type uncharacterized transport system involved in gliding motility auxiliary subunit
LEAYYAVQLGCKHKYSLYRFFSTTNSSYYFKFTAVVTTLLNFTGMFNKAHEENCKQLELEMKKTAESEKKKCESERILPTAIRTGNVK